LFLAKEKGGEKIVNTKKVNTKQKFDISVSVRDRHNVTVAMSSSDSSAKCANSKDCKN